MLLHQTPAGWFRFGAITLQLTRPVTHPCRAGSLPAVCRSFRRLLRGPSSCLWPDISFSADISLPPQVQRTSNFLAWLRHHGRRCRQLQLDMWNGGLPPQALLAVRQLGLQLEDTLAGGCGGWVAGWLGGWVGVMRTDGAHCQHACPAVAFPRQCTSAVQCAAPSAAAANPPELPPLVPPTCLPAETLHCCEFLRVRWGGRRLVVGDWVASARALTCLALRWGMRRRH